MRFVLLQGVHVGVVVVVVVLVLTNLSTPLGFSIIVIGGKYQCLPLPSSSSSVLHTSRDVDNDDGGGDGPLIHVKQVGVELQS